MADRRVEAQLRALVRGETPTGPAGRELLHHAEWHGLVSRLRHARPDVDGVEPAYLRGQAERMRVLHDLPFVAGVLAPFAWAVVKGPVLSELVYRESGRRTFADLDVLVAPASFGAAVAALQDAGAELLDRNWALAARQRRAELSLRLPGGATLDLHWSLINDAATRRALPLPDVLAARRPVTLAGVTVTALEPVDALVHVCLHGVLAGGQRLLWVSDVAESLAHVSPRDLRARAGGYGLALPVDVALHRADTVLGVAGPRPAGAWGALMRGLARRRPPGCDYRARPTGATLVAATRGSSTASVGALVRTLADRRALAARPADLARPVDGGWRDTYLRDVVLGS